MMMQNTTAAAASPDKNAVRITINHKCIV
jgi:hypothetical protein